MVGGGGVSSVLEELQDLAQLSSTLLCSGFFFIYLRSDKPKSYGLVAVTGLKISLILIFNMAQPWHVWGGDATVPPL